MPSFLVTFAVNGDLDPDPILALEKKVIGHLPREIQWLMSWYAPEENLLLSFWQAPSAQAVSVVLARAECCEKLTLQRIEPVEAVYPRRYANAHMHARHTKKAHPAGVQRPHAEHEWYGTYAEAVGAKMQMHQAKPPRSRS